VGTRHRRAPPAADVTEDVSLFTVDHPEQFPLATADARSPSSELVVTGTVTPDVARNVPVVSLASAGDGHKGTPQRHREERPTAFDGQK